ncbi:hypothetical protein O181_031176 [Austropuccinia psidii MF-1]|uniref:Uncharacterized protein n=1 Tax=Austropuccinia psidii MF-1 TaxID=1389203 RepID=A0A9Q3CUC3_9BASI|nr:hypothetical protein [Austropuccinia psidii MF-1]
MKLNQIILNTNRQTELWHEMKIKEEMYKIELINLIKCFQHEFRNSTSRDKSKINKIEQLLHTLPGIPIPLNKSKGVRDSNPQVFDVENSQINNEFSTYFHTLEPLKEVPKLKELTHFSGEGEYDPMGFIRGIDMIKEEFELPDRLVTARFNILFTK